MYLLTVVHFELENPVNSEVCLSAVPSARILGGPDLHVDIGSTINLTCLIQFSPEPPAYIFWYHEDEVSGRKVIIPIRILFLG